MANVNDNERGQFNEFSEIRFEMTVWLPDASWHSSDFEANCFVEWPEIKRKLQNIDG